MELEANISLSHQFAKLNRLNTVREHPPSTPLPYGVLNKGKCMTSEEKDGLGCLSILIIIVILVACFVNYHEQALQKAFEQKTQWANEQKTAKMIGVYATYNKGGSPVNYVQIFETKDGTRFKTETDKLPIINETYEIKVQLDKGEIKVVIGDKIK